jgi:hypothetical protein
VQRKKSQIRRAWLPALFGALAALLAGCANEGGIPFMTPAAPPSPGPQPEYPTLVSPPRDEEKPPILNEAQRQALEKELDKAATERETGIRRRLEKNP